MSRLNASKDIRLVGDVQIGAELPHTADNVCLVPEPYCRTIRPDQRVRAASAIQQQEDICPSLEEQRRLFAPQIVEPEGRSKYRYYTDGQLRNHLQNNNRPVLGSRHKLLERISSKRDVANMSPDELDSLSSRLGLDSNRDRGRKERIKELKEEGNVWWLDLSVDDLVFENQYRGIAVSCEDSKKLLLNKIRHTKTMW